MQQHPHESSPSSDPQPLAAAAESGGEFEAGDPPVSETEPEAESVRVEGDSLAVAEVVETGVTEAVAPSVVAEVQTVPEPQEIETVTEAAVVVPVVAAAAALPVAAAVRAPAGAAAVVEAPAGTVVEVAAPVADSGWRLTSMDAFRGFVMLLMMGEVLEFSKVAESLPDNAFWQTLALHQTHVAWGGCVLHDLIQPSFSFLVGVALPFSLARRTVEGQPQWRRTLHAWWRALFLVLLGVFLRSTHSDLTNWTFEDTLSQIGLGYGFLYLLALKSPKVQAITGGALLVLYWLAFGLYPIVAGSGPYTGFAAHWNLNANPAWAFDRWFLNLFPREAPFKANGGGYSTLSFIPTLVTMILGLLAGGLLRAERGPWVKLGWLVLAGGVGLGAGWGLDALGVCPVVKKIWTPAWVLYSGGAACLILAGFYLVMDIWRLRRWALFLTVVGMNSIAAYLIAHLFQGFIADALTRHFGHRPFEVAGAAYQPFVHGLTVLVIEWLMLWWMFRRKVFLRI